MSSRIARALGAGLVVGFLVAVVPACSGTKPECSASNCATGCCDADGVCQLGTQQSACGQAGAVCQACSSAQFCQAGFCQGSTSNNKDGGNNPGGDAGTDGGNNPGALVEGVRVTRYLSPSGETTAPVSLQTRPINAWTVSGNTLTPATVTDTGDGGFTIDVPQGATYYVADGRSALVTDARTLDLGRWMQGNRDVTPPAQPVQSITVSAAGMQPWVDGDQFQLSSETSWEMGYCTPASPPAAGATSVTAAPCNYSTLVNGSLDAAKGDVADFHQVRNEELIPDAGVFQSYIVASGNAGPVTLDGTTATQVNVVMAPVQQKLVTADLRITEFDTVAAEVNPSAVASGGTTTIIAIPQGLSRGYVGYMAELHASFIDGLTQDTTVSLRYGNPKSSWGELADAAFYQLVPVKLPNATQGWVTAITDRMGTTTQVFGSPVRPNMRPPRNLLLDGNDAWTAGTLGSLTPVLSWSAPLQGTPTGYAVRIRELTVDANNRTRSVLRGSIVTTGTSVTVPPGFLQSGKSYLFLVAANHRSGGLYDVKRAPFYDWLSDESAEVSSAQFQAP